MTVDLHQTQIPYGNAYNESSADGVTPRPHWAQLMEGLAEIGPEELEHRWARAERRIRENGVMYNIYRRESSVENRHCSIPDCSGRMAPD